MVTVTREPSNPVPGNPEVRIGCFGTIGCALIDPARISRLYGMSSWDCGLYRIRLRGSGRRYYVRTWELSRVIFNQAGKKGLA